MTLYFLRVYLQQKIMALYLEVRRQILVPNSNKIFKKIAGLFALQQFGFFISYGYSDYLPTMRL